MSFIRRKGKTVTRWLPMTASTVATAGQIASYASGQLIVATSATTALSHVGVFKKTIKSTDSDYATGGRLVPVECALEKGVWWEADVTATAVAADVGLQCDLTDGGTVNRAANSVHAVLVQAFVSTTKLLVTILFEAGQN